MFYVEEKNEGKKKVCQKIIYGLKIISGSWQLTVGRWQLTVGRGKLADGGWQVAVGRW